MHNEGDPIFDRAGRVIEEGDKVVVICDYKDGRATGAVGEITEIVAHGHSSLVVMKFSNGEEWREPREHVLKLRDTLEFE